MKTVDDLPVFDRKIFTSPGANFYSNKIYNLFFDLYIQRRIIYPMSIFFFEMSSYWKKLYYWYLTITNMR